MSAARFAAAFAAMSAAHTVGDHWVQTSTQAKDKGLTSDQSWKGRAACARHVATLTATKAVALAATEVATRAGLKPRRVAAGLALDAVSHWAIDRRWTLRALAHLVGKGEFYTMGSDVATIDGKPAMHLGTGAYAMDQSAHIGCLLVATLIAGSGDG